jgi:uncharacterized Ntn-hydrolase superfamily protein
MEGDFLMHVQRNQLVDTYSIVARDPDTGEMGVAVQSHWFSVGSVVSWAQAGVGAIATQAFVNVSFGPRGLELLRQGQNASQVVQALIESDAVPQVRQLALVDAEGRVAAHTGTKCVPEAGHHVGDGYAVQANLMLNDRVWPAMAQAFETSTGPLPERLIKALKAAQKEGGDIRGKQSAALLVVKGQSTDQPWEDTLIDLRVEDHAQPVQELRRLLTLFRAYEHMNAGDEALEKQDVKGALKSYGAAQALFPDHLEMKYWHAIALANLGRLEEALPIFETVFARDDNWRTLTQRLPAVDLLEVSQPDLEKILAQ